MTAAKEFELWLHHDLIFYVLQSFFSVPVGSVLSVGLFCL